MSEARTRAPERTVAEELLEHLRSRGFTTIFVNAGTDFAPLVEAYARRAEDARDAFPAPILATHENLAMGMAHGAYLASGKPQAVMFHVSVGTANAICGVMNAARDDVPVLVMAGRTPVLESGALGARDTRIQWGQEMFDQGGLLREFVKWDHELRDPRQTGPALGRAVAVATAHPQGPVYLTLPRELLAEPSAESVSDGQAPAPEYGPNPALVEELADRIAAATLPIVVTSSLGRDPDAVEKLAAIADRFGIGVVEAEPRRVNLPTDHPCHLGYDARAAVAASDVVCYLECAVPWIADSEQPRADAFVAQIAADPHYSDYLMRTHRADISIASGPSLFLDALHAALTQRSGGRGARQDVIADLRNTWRSKTTAEREHEQQESGPITKAFLSATLSGFMSEHRKLFNEYWVRPDLLDLRSPGTYFFLPLAGGLGWGVPAAIGARSADSSSTTIAAVGDGAYLFANPAACHHVAQKYELPFLTVIANNSSWHTVDLAAQMVYPRSAVASKYSAPLSDLSPMPELERYVEASGGVGLRVAKRAELHAAVEEGLSLVENASRQVVINVDCI